MFDLDDTEAPEALGADGAAQLLDVPQSVFAIEGE